MSERLKAGEYTLVCGLLQTRTPLFVGCTVPFRSNSQKVSVSAQETVLGAMATPFRCFILCVVLFNIVGCDHGLAPPDEPAVGSIEGVIHYNIASWPPADTFFDLRFVALPFVPRDSTDLLSDLNALVISPGLRLGVATDTFQIAQVNVGTYVYNGVAQQFGPGLLDWRPVGLYEDNGGIFLVRPNETTQIEVIVDFNVLPPFPPPP